MEKLTLLQRIIEWVPELRFLKDTARTWDKHSIVFANGSSIIAHGYDANVRGGHPLLLILDDPIDTKVVYSELLNQRSIERFYSEFLPMARKDTQVLIIGTVQREKDLYGSLDPSIWTVKIYSAILDEEKHLTLCPELWDWDSLQRRKTEIVYVNGDRYWRKEYLNDPKALVGQIFREGWFRYFENSPGDLSVYIGMDPSVGQTVQSDYTAIVAVGISSDNHFYILDVERGRWTLPDRLRILERMCNIHNPRKVGIESVAFSFDTVKQAVETFRYPVLEVKCAGAKAAKMARAEALSVYFRNEKIYMKCKGYDKNQIPLLDKKFIDLRDELIGFPGNFDDQMDALHIAVTMASDEGWKPLRNSTDTFWEGLIKGGSKTQTNPFIKSF
jgi:phage terminase large subunit-like protein